MRKLQEESQKTITEIQQKLKEGKEQLAAHSSKENTSLRTKKLEEKLRNIRLSKRRLEDELVEAIGRAARSKEEVMEIRQTMHENSSKVERNVAEMTELKSSLTAKEKELKDLHEYVENIHYTLSTKGVLEPKKENGDGTATEIPDNGKLVDLESQTWSVSESRKKGALRAKLTNQSGVIDHLHHTLGRLDKERADALRRAERAEKTIDVQGVEISKLKEAVAKMKQEASRAANRVESLSKIIVQERQMLQARMEKVREALMNVESARKLKLANNDRSGGSSSLVGGGGSGGGWASGSDRAAAVAQRKNSGQEPQTAPEAVRANSASGVGGASRGGGGGGGGAGEKSRFVSPSVTPTPSPKPLPQSPPTSGTFFFGAATTSSNKSATHRGRHQPEPHFKWNDGKEIITPAVKSRKARRRSQSRGSKDRGRRCPVCREPFSPVATKSSIQSHINSHQVQNRDSFLGRLPIQEDESRLSNHNNSGERRTDNGRKGGSGNEQLNPRKEGAEKNDGEKKEGKPKEGKSAFSSSREKVAGLTKKWNSFAGNAGKSWSSGSQRK